MAQIGRSLGYAYDIREFGAVGDGKTENRRTIQAAIDACTAAGGGTVYCPPGRYLTGTLEIKSNVNLHLDSGATLLGSTNRGDYVTISYPLSGPPRPGATIEHLIFARKAQNVAITGLGTIDGQGDEFFEQRPGRARLSPKAWRPWRMISFLDCRNVTMENVTVRNSPAFTIWPLGCDNVIIRGVRIFNNPIGPNSDGIDPDCCRGVTISNCHIDVGDDAIALKTSVDKLGRIKACEDVVVTNCTLVTTCCAVRIGYEGDAPIRNCTFSNLAISRCRTGINMLVPGHSDWKDSLITHGPAIENIRFSNLIMDTRVPLFLWIGDDAKRPGGIRNIAISDVYATTERGCFVGGTRAIPVEGLQLRNWRLEVRGEMDDEFG